MSERFVNVDRKTPMLLPRDMREWVPEDDLVHFVIEAVESMSMGCFRVNERGAGSPQYPPSMMPALLIYCYANGIFSSRRIERATYRDVAVRYLAGNTHPDHDTIAKFRRENFEAVAACFLRVLELARELGLLTVGTVSVDGTKIRANANKKRSGRRKGKRIKPPDPTPRAEEQDNLTDPDSRLMRRSKTASYKQAYNAQAAVDADGSRLVLGARVSDCASDRNELVADVRSIPASVGKPKVVLADNGYLNENEVRTLEGANKKPKMEVLISVHAEAKHNRRKHDFRPLPAAGKEPPQIRSEFVLEMKEKMEREESSSMYRLRKQTVEPVFGIIKKWIGFRQFLLRGLEKVSGEWRLVTLAYNFKRLWRLERAPRVTQCAAAAGRIYPHSSRFHPILAQFLRRITLCHLYLVIPEKYCNILILLDIGVIL